MSGSEVRRALFTAMDPDGPNSSPERSASSELGVTPVAIVAVRSLAGTHRPEGVSQASAVNGANMSGNSEASIETVTAVASASSGEE